MRLIISGGGTGGHIFPAIAIAKAIKKNDPNSKILFVGAKGKMEMEKVPAAGFEIKGLWISGFQRGRLWVNVLLPFKIIHSLIMGLWFVLRFKPDLIIGTGGYASWAVVFAGALLRKKILLQEQNSFAGLTNRFLSRWADAVCVAYPNMELYFSKSKVFNFGNPVRSDIGKALLDRELAFQTFGLSSKNTTLLVLGGSLGARTINRAMRNCYEKILQTQTQIIWQTGKIYFDSIIKEIKPHPNLKIMPFISQMPEAYEISDLVVSRAGALSISEISVVALPAILVPSPNVAQDHQTHNAKVLAEQDAAVLLPDHQAEAELGEKVLELLEDRQKRIQLSNKISIFAKKEAAEQIAALSARLLVDSF